MIRSMFLLNLMVQIYFSHGGKKLHCPRLNATDFKHDVFCPQTYMFAIIDCGDRMTKKIGVVFKVELHSRKR